MDWGYDVYLGEFPFPYSVILDFEQFQNEKYWTAITIEGNLSYNPTAITSNLSLTGEVCIIEPPTGYSGPNSSRPEILQCVWTVPKFPPVVKVVPVSNPLR